MLRHLNSSMNIVACKQCEKKVHGEKGETKHMKRFHSEHVKQLNCEMCGRMFDTKKTLEIHINQHSSEISGGRFKCERCGVFMTQKNSLLRHNKNKHTEVDAEQKTDGS